MLRSLSRSFSSLSLTTSSLVGAARPLVASFRSPFAAPTVLRSSPVAAPSPAASSQLQALRGSKYTNNKKKRLPGYILPKQSSPTATLKKMLKMKFFRLKRGKAGQRPKAPAYGRNDFIMSKMNF
eukprot:jgi/Hompol1/341/HPOL_004243-RA